MPFKCQYFSKPYNLRKQHFSDKKPLVINRCILYPLVLIIRGYVGQNYLLTILFEILRPFDSKIDLEPSILLSIDFIVSVPKIDLNDC